MKKPTINLACILSCFILLTGCTDQKGNDDQNSNVNGSVEVDINDEAKNSGDPTNPDSSSDDFIYNPKNSENSDDIEVRPKE